MATDSKEKESKADTAAFSETNTAKISYRRSLSRASTFFLVRRAALIIYQGLEEFLKELDLTVAKFMVLNTLGRRADRSSAELARTLSMKPQSMLKVILALEGRGLVTRSEYARDKRVLRVRLTNEGRDILVRCNEGVAKLERKLLGDFTPDELLFLRESLIHIAVAER